MTTSLKSCIFLRVQGAVLLAVFCLATHALTLAPGENKVEIQRPEGTRKFYVWVPKTFNASAPAPPIVFALHGLNDACDKFARSIGMQALADQQGFLFVYPCGTKGLLGVAWNAGTCCLRGSKIDDVAFMGAVVQWMQQNFLQVNTSRVFMSGFSNGAMLTEVLACKQPTLFAAYAAVSGVVEIEPGMDAGLQKCDTEFAATSGSAAILKVHGNADIVVPWTGDALLGYPPVPQDFAGWAARLKCSGTPVQTFKNGPYSNQVYQNCSRARQAELMKHDGGSHEWPRDKYFDTTAYVWSYFQKFL